MTTTNSSGNFSHEEKPMVNSLLYGMFSTSYEAPVTTRNVVETEGSFCASVVQDGKNASVNTSNHEVQTDYYETQPDGSSKNPFDFTEDSWD